MESLSFLQAASITKGAVAPQFSPDGTLLRYELDGQTFLWNVRAERVVGRFEGCLATWSADSARLAFVRGADVHVAERSGDGARLVGHGTAPCWGPEGATLYWADDSGGQCRLMRSNTDSPHEPEEVAVAAGEWWTLSSQGPWLVHLRAQPNTKQMAALPPHVVQVGASPELRELRAVNVMARDSVTGGPVPRGSALDSPAWSSDGRTLAWTRELNSSWVEPGPLDRCVCVWQPGEAAPSVIELGEGVSGSCAAWSPDGTRLALLANPWGRYTTDPFGWLTVFDVRAGEVCWQCRDLVCTTVPKWSSDGTTICCRTGYGDQQPYEGFSADGRHLGKLTPDGQYCAAAALSPDGALLAVSARAFSGVNEIWLCPLDRTRPTRITAATDAIEDLGLSRVWTHQWTTPDGTVLRGPVIEPSEASVPTAPLLVFLAGGPERGFEICCLEAGLGYLLHAAAQRGYRVFIASHRRTGLVGLQYLMQQWHPADAAADVAAGVESLCERIGAAAGPIAAFGQSAGGDLVCQLLVSHPSLLEAAVVAGIQPDFGHCYSIEGTSNPIMRQVFGGPPWASPREYLEASPIRGVERINAAVLIMMGSRDTSCPTAERFYVALSEAGRDVTYLQFRDQGHWPEDPERVAAYIDVAISWLDRRLGRGRDARGDPNPAA
ncbi:MAG: S9 family peptidase [Armatimonadota bacterium]